MNTLRNEDASRSTSNRISLLRLHLYYLIAFAFITIGYITYSGTYNETITSIYSATLKAASALNELRAFGKSPVTKIYILPSEENPGRIVNFPPLLGLEVNSWKDLLRNKDQLSKKEKLQVLTNGMQKHLEYFQANASCSNYTFRCGHHYHCGLGCQLQHRTACVLVSYTMGIPLIHDTSRWPSLTPWEELYKKVGSSCPENNNTIIYRFRSRKSPLILHLSKQCYTKAMRGCSNLSQFEYPLEKGVPIPRDLYELVKEVHEDPYLWYIGQFLKYVIRYNSTTEGMLKESQATLGLGSTTELAHTVGLHIRRTDKAYESGNGDTRHPLHEYMNWTEAYFKSAYPPDFSPRPVFLASDDHRLLGEAQERYPAPLWKICGFKTNTSYGRPSERRSDEATRSIIKDVHFLTAYGSADQQMSCMQVSTRAVSNQIPGHLEPDQVPRWSLLLKLVSGDSTEPSDSSLT